MFRFKRMALYLARMIQLKYSSRSIFTLSLIAKHSVDALLEAPWFSATELSISHTYHHSSICSAMDFVLFHEKRNCCQFKCVVLTTWVEFQQLFLIFHFFEISVTRHHIFGSHDIIYYGRYNLAKSHCMADLDKIMWALYAGHITVCFAHLETLGSVMMTFVTPSS